MRHKPPKSWIERSLTLAIGPSVGHYDSWNQTGHFEIHCLFAASSGSQWPF